MKDSIKLFLIKLLHTLIWIVFAGAVVYILLSALLDQVNILTWVAIGLTIFEGLVLLIFSWSCPLTLVARRYSDSERDNFDIFLPNWLARHNKTIFTSLFVLGLGLVIWRIVM
jgi:hypothetical protein